MLALIYLALRRMLALILLRSMRSATPWQPRVRLGEWMELPVPSRASATQPVVADPLAGVRAIDAVPGRSCRILCGGLPVMTPAGRACAAHYRISSIRWGTPSQSS